MSFVYDLVDKGLVPDPLIRTGIRRLLRQRLQEITPDGPDAARQRLDELVEGIQLEAIVKRALAQLEPDFRELVVLRDVEDLTYEQIAEVTGLPRGTVKSRIHRGRQQLRQRVEQLLGAKLSKTRKP